VDIYRIRAEHAGTTLVDLAQVEFTPTLLACIPADLVRKYRVLPVAQATSTIVVATADPLNPNAFDDLSFALGREIQLRVAEESQIAAYIKRFYDEDKAPG
jgi:type IV pilus assembly protein PilB